MRIAQIATLYESVPPAAYGGIERVVSWLTEGLVARGHDVTLFASGDSRTDARLVPATATSLREIEHSADPQAFHFAMLEQVVRRSDGSTRSIGGPAAPPSKRALPSSAW